jgi:outer membrane protein assembly factor BamB
MSYRVSGRKIELSSGKSLAFKHKIREAVETETAIIVCLDVPTNRKLEDNIYAISYDGELLWQVAPTQHSMKNSCYIGVSKVGGLIRAFNFDGMVYDLDPKDGKIVNQYFGK